MKKLISVFIALVMAVSTLSVAVSSQAAVPEDCFVITVSGQQYNGIANSAVSYINSKRAKNKLSSITPDVNLQKIAQKRACEIMLAYDSEDMYLPNGDSIYADLPGYGINQDTIFGELSSINANDLAERLSDLYTAKNVMSIGVAVFSYNGIITYYAIVSSEASSDKNVPTTTSSYSRNVNLHYMFVSDVYLDTFEGNNYTEYFFCIYASGYSTDMIYVPRAQYTVSSSKPSIYKVKNYIGYVKKTGNYTILINDTRGNLLASANGYCTAQTYTPSITKLTGKSKAITVKWYDPAYNSSGYQIQYSTKKNMKGAKTITFTKKSSYSKKIKKLKKRKTYYVRIRSYLDQGNGEKMYSSWSSKKKIKTK